MKKVLRVDSGINKANSVTRNLTDDFIRQWKENHPDDIITVRDVIDPLIPHIDETIVAGFFTPPEHHSPKTQEVTQLSDELIGEILEADVIVLGAPVYNLGIPSTLKSYIDHIVRVGKTFNYTEKGPQGFVEGKKLYIITARGGLSDPDQDVHANYLKQIFGFLGISEIQFFQAQGLAFGEESKESAVQNVKSSIRKMTAA